MVEGERRRFGLLVGRVEALQWDRVADLLEEQTGHTDYEHRAKVKKWYSNTECRGATRGRTVEAFLPQTASARLRMEFAGDQLAQASRLGPPREWPPLGGLRAGEAGWVGLAPRHINWDSITSRRE